VFNLVKYRYVFLIISLLVIIPGAISLAIFGLNVGIDFAGGSSMEFMPQTAVSNANDVKALLGPLHLEDPQVVLGQNNNLPPKKTVWIRLNTTIDATVQQNIRDLLTKKYSDTPKLPILFTDIAQGNDAKQSFTVVTVSGFTNAPTIDDVTSTLSKIPNTTPSGTNTTPQATPTAAATAKATVTPAAKATATPTAVATPTATPTPNANATIPVKVVDVKQGTTNQTISILTKSELKSQDLPKIQQYFLAKNGPYLQVLITSEVGSVVAGETTRNAVLAVLAASACILLYIWFSFRKVAKAWRYGTCAIIAMLHDVLVVVGVFSILGVLFKTQIDALFITALLTVVGFSVHDTIVVFDRVRENMQRRTTETFEQVVNASLIQTMARSLNTSLTVLFTLLALTLFGSSTSVHTFTLTLLIGIFSGTYSSIFNASMLLVIWEKGELGLGLLSRKGESTTSKREARELARTRG